MDKVIDNIGTILLVVGMIGLALWLISLSLKRDDDLEV